MDSAMARLDFVDSLKPYTDFSSPDRNGMRSLITSLAALNLTIFIPTLVSIFGTMEILSKLSQYESTTFCCSQTETTKLTQELTVKLEQGRTSVSGTQWQTEE